MGHDLTGQRFGRLLVLERGENDRGGHARWVCRCDCAATRIVRGGSLRSGNTVSCGCWGREQLAINHLSHLTHGHSRHGRETTEYRTWQGMLARCSNPNMQNFKNYGARGITVCARWRDSFEAFLFDMGPKPRPELTLDRIDNERGYCKDNCRWATASEQRRNQRSQKEV